MNKRLRRKLRPLRHRCVYCLAVIGRWFFNRLPLNAAVRLGGLFGRLARPFCFKLCRIARGNLDRAFGDQKTAAEKNEILRKMFDHLGRAVVETLTFENWSVDTIRARIQGDERMCGLDAFRNGNGLLIITGHFGSWELFSGYVARGLGLPLGVVARDLKNPRLERLLLHSREKQNLEILLRGKAGRALFRHLRDNKIMGLLADQDTKRGPGVFVNFFGRPAYTPLGPWQLAARTGCAAIVACIVRQPDGLTHCVEFERELTLPPDADSEQAAREFTQAFTSGIENFVRRHPEQWTWFHRRWRRRPAPQAPSQTWSKGDPYLKSNDPH